MVYFDHIHVFVEQPKKGKCTIFGKKYAKKEYKNAPRTILSVMQDFSSFTFCYQVYRFMFNMRKDITVKVGLLFSHIKKSPKKSHLKVS